MARSVQGGSGNDTLIGTSGNDVYTDAELGDHVILENGETAGSAGATSEVVEIDGRLGKSHELIAPGNRFEFRTRVEDDLELLRSVRSGQDMLTGLAGITESTGNRTLITELDPIEDTIVLSGSTYSTDGGFASATTTDYFTEYGDTPAAGTDSLVRYNTSTNIELRESTGLQAVPPIVVLFHEMSHAFNQTSGTAILREYSVPGERDFGVNNLERQAVGLSVSVDGDGDPTTVDQEDRPNIVSVNVDLNGDGITDIVIDQPTENDLRSELGMDDRVSYRL